MSQGQACKRQPSYTNHIKEENVHINHIPQTTPPNMRFSAILASVIAIVASVNARVVFDMNLEVRQFVTATPGPIPPNLPQAPFPPQNQPLQTAGPQGPSQPNQPAPQQPNGPQPLLTQVAVRPRASPSPVIKVEVINFPTFTPVF
ncbi:hypothetical protein HDU97_002825 [Phlyctochytrium planicorne]|nr:hypothetical protein HDU97_002825 [Phlyctochytrium planicorne]